MKKGVWKLIFSFSKNFNNTASKRYLCLRLSYGIIFSTFFIYNVTAFIIFWILSKVLKYEKILKNINIYVTSTFSIILKYKSFLNILLKCKFYKIFAEYYNLDVWKEETKIVCSSLFILQHKFKYFINLVFRISLCIPFVTENILCVSVCQYV